MKFIKTVQEVADFTVSGDRKLFSATHEEVEAGLTTDIYFVKTREILEKLGRADTVVAAEIFARGAGVFAGVEEVKRLLAETGVEVWSLP